MDLSGPMRSMPHVGAVAAPPQKSGQRVLPSTPAPVEAKALSILHAHKAQPARKHEGLAKARAKAHANVDCDSAASQSEAACIKGRLYKAKALSILKRDGHDLDSFRLGKGEICGDLSGIWDHPLAEASSESTLEGFAEAPINLDFNSEPSSEGEMFGQDFAATGSAATGAAVRATGHSPPVSHVQSWPKQDRPAAGHSPPVSRVPSGPKQEIGLWQDLATDCLQRAFDQCAGNSEVLAKAFGVDSADLQRLSPRNSNDFITGLKKQAYGEAEPSPAGREGSATDPLTRALCALSHSAAHTGWPEAGRNTWPRAIPKAVSGAPKRPPAGPLTSLASSSESAHGSVAARRKDSELRTQRRPYWSTPAPDSSAYASSSCDALPELTGTERTSEETRKKPAFPICENCISRVILI